MTSQFSDRKYVIIAIFSSIILIFLGRLFYIQIVDDQYKLTARNQAFRYMVDYPSRGNIFDRNGIRLVYNQAAYDLMVIPRQVVALVKEDATVLNSYESFWAALAGPDCGRLITFAMLRSLPPRPGCR